MKINTITNSSGTVHMSRAGVTHDIIKNTERYLDSSAVQFIDATPIICDYYSTDKLASVVSTGDKTTLGAFSGATKYKYIKDMVIYGYPEEKNTTIDQNEQMNTKVDLESITALVLPNTLNCVVGDRLTLKLENNAIWYKVDSVEPVTFHNKPYFKIEYSVDDTLKEQNWTLAHMKTKGLVTKEYIFIQENVGTDYSPFLEEVFYKKINTIRELRKDLNDLFIDYFYKEFTNMLVCHEADKDGDLKEDRLEYYPFVVDLQMEYKPLYVFDINMILHHEELLSINSKTNFKRHPIRKFFKREENDLINGEDVNPLKFYKYQYVNNPAWSEFKIESYMNSTDMYKVFDYNKGTRREEVNIEIPSEIKKLMLKYFKNELTVDGVITFLKEYDIEELNGSYLIGTVIGLIIVERIFEESISIYKIERFY